ncbi:hypothetical protein [Pseudorhodoferax soli]|uniref:Uncharacterized protein n=1 Tax=Pseudorhodoferax soli TaxID=545864 RepID=A0A368XGD3_9BURK|nr:hypothetical protein [Pseudorhodoferax soli]RCW66895.1 hypothetical protein DES41_110260 [Pseudorhodoferax soli]
MSTASLSQSSRRVPYLLGGTSAHAATAMPRHALPALFLPLPRAAILAAMERGTR